MAGILPMAGRKPAFFECFGMLMQPKKRDIDHGDFPLSLTYVRYVCVHLYVYLLMYTFVGTSMAVSQWRGSIPDAWISPQHFASSVGHSWSLLMFFGLLPNQVWQGNIKEQSSVEVICCLKMLFEHFDMCRLILSTKKALGKALRQIKTVAPRSNFSDRDADRSRFSWQDRPQ